MKTLLHALPVLLAGLVALTACDSGIPEEKAHACDTDGDGFYVSADLNGEEWCGQSRATLFFTGDTFYPRADSLFGLEAASTLRNGFVTGRLTTQIPFRGTSTYEIDFAQAGRVAGPNGRDSLLTHVQFIDLQHDAILARLGVKRDEVFRLTVESYDRQTSEVQGSFAGTFTYQSGRRATDSLRNYRIDTLRFENGDFVARVQPIRRHVE